MRRLLFLLGFALLALPSSAAAQSLEYAAPTASISRGAPLTFAVRTTAPAGAVVVRVSGNDETDDTGLLTGPGGHVAGRDRHARDRGSPGLERPRLLGPAPAARALLLAGVPDGRRRDRRRGADRAGAGARRHDADGRPRPRQALPALRPPRQGQLLPVVGELPGERRRRAIPDADQEDVRSLGAEGQAVDERSGRCRGRLQRGRILHSRPGRHPRRPDRLHPRRRRRRARPRAQRERELGRRPGLSGARRGRPRERPAPRARPHGGQQAPSRSAAPTRRWARRSAPASGGAGRATSGSAAARRAPERLH